MEPGHLEVIAQSGQERVYQSGQVIFRQGEPADRLFLVLEGKWSWNRATGRGRTGWCRPWWLGMYWGGRGCFQPFVWHFQARGGGENDGDLFQRRAFVDCV